MALKQIWLNLGALAVLMAVLALVYWQHTGVRAVPELVQALQGRDLQTQMLAVQGLKQIGQPALAAIPRLTELATVAGGHSVHIEAAGALPPIDLSAARQVMIAWLPKLQDPDPQVRRDAAGVLGALGPVAKPAVHSLLGISNDPNTAVRDRVVRALAAIALPPDLVMRGLLQALQDPEWTVRYAAVTSFSFGAISNPESLALLRTLTQDNNQMVARLAQSAVAAAEHPIPVSVHLFALDQGEDRTHPLVQLSKLGRGAAEAVPRLTTLLTSQRPLERYLAAMALTCIGPAAASAVPMLQRSLQDPDPIVREAVAEALQGIEGRSKSGLP
jgi:HEAT repeat protein